MESGSALPCRSQEPAKPKEVRYPRMKARPPFTQFGTEGDEMQHRPPEPVQTRDHQDVAAAQQLEDQIQLRSRGLAPLARST